MIQMAVDWQASQDLLTYFTSIVKLLLCSLKNTLTETDFYLHVLVRMHMYGYIQHPHTQTHTHMRTHMHTCIKQLQFVLMCLEMRRRTKWYEWLDSSMDGKWSKERKAGRNQLTVVCIHYSCQDKSIARHCGNINIHQPPCPPPLLFVRYWWCNASVYVCVFLSYGKVALWDTFLSKYQLIS